jgi:hypothetical protein
MRWENGEVDLKTNTSTLRVRMLAAIVVSALVLSLMLSSVGRTKAHTGDWIDSAFTVAPPTIDGAMGVGEWSDARTIDLGAIPDNNVPAYLLVKNDATYIYIAYDAIGDTTSSPSDVASISFDTNHDLASSVGAEDAFILGEGTANGQGHYTYDGMGWSEDCSPFDTLLPGHSGLAGAYGYGPSDLSPTDHQIYELQIPLALVDPSGMSVIGFLGASEMAPGVLDTEVGFDYSTWPVYLFSLPGLDSFGDLRLGNPSQPDDFNINPPSDGFKGAVGSMVNYTLNVVNLGTSIDTFDLGTVAVWPTSLWDATGMNPLPDTDADLVPDTGALPPGGGADIIVRVQISAIGCDDATVVGVSSNNVNVVDMAVLHTCAPDAFLNPPHSDMGVDTDLPPNGLFDELRIDVGVLVNTAGDYEVDVDLFDLTLTTWITYGVSTVSLPSGPAIVPVSIPGPDIYISGIDGPYFAYIALYDNLGNFIEDGSYATGSYLYTDFDLPGAALNPPHSDVGVDTDLPPNGLFDELRIDVGVLVSAADVFEVSVDLFDQTMSVYIGSASNVSLLPIGPVTVPVSLPGTLIHDSGIDGPYLAWVILYDQFGNVLDSGNFLTQSYLFIDFEGASATLNPPYSDVGVDTDMPPNGLFNILRLDVGVSVTMAGIYRVNIDLWDQFGMTWITTANKTSFLPAGSNMVSVDLSGVDIHASGIDGPYLASITLWDGMGNPLGADMYTTGPYFATDFDQAGTAAVLSPPHSDWGSDSDIPPNGLYNELVIDVNVMVNVAATYRIDIDLWDAMGMNWITAGTMFAGLSTGLNAVSCPLSGIDIYGSGIDGPYLAYISLHDDMGMLLDQGNHLTASYLHTEFDGGGAALNPPHSDTGVDTDVPPNGRFDELRIDVGVMVTVPGFYEVTVNLWDLTHSLWITFSDAYASLPIGPNTVSVSLQGLDIYNSGIDGPYYADIQLYDYMGNLLDTGSHITASYLSSDFDPPPGSLEPPHSDHGLDLTVPPDGLYEFLEVDVMVNVAEPATFTVNVDLYDSTGSFLILSANTVSTLGVGIQSVPVKLDGIIIQASGFDGPYEAHIHLYYNSSQLDSGLHMTQAYLHSDFAPAGAAFEPPYSDRAVDEDLPPDGLADSLLVDVYVNITVPGSYSIDALLLDMSLNFFDIASERGTFPVGLFPITLSFDGHRIAESGVDGPYEVLMVIHDAFSRQLDNDMYTTSAYSSNQFEPPDVLPPVSTVTPTSYWKNYIPLQLSFTAADQSPSDGLDTMTLYYRYSTDNSSWGLYTPYASVPLHGATAGGTIPFTFPQGAGYYEFQTTAVDVAGNQEIFGPPEGQVAYRPLAELRFQPSTLPLTAGLQSTLTISVLSTDGQPAMLEAPLVVNLDTYSLSGEYRAVSGSTAITNVTIAAGSSSASVDYYDTTAGTWTLLGYANSGLGGMGAASVIPSSIASITVDPGAATVAVTETKTFTAIVRDSYGNRISGTTITWDVTSSLGTVDATGLFTAGTVARTGTITARSGSIQGSADLILTPGPAAAIEVTPDSATIQSGTEVTIVAEVVDAHGNVINAATVAWSVSGPGTVGPGSGQSTTLTANGAGTISVTATLGSLSAAATFTSVEAGGGGFSSTAIAGMAGGLIGGILGGFAVGWILHKRRNKPQQSEQTQAPPPPPANLPPSQPPEPPKGT